MALDFSKKSSLLILDLINTKSKQPLVAAEIVVGPATVAEGDERYNSQLEITPSGTNSKLISKGVLRYNRIDVAAMFAPVLDDATIQDEEGLSVAAILNTLNSRFALGLSDEDFDITLIVKDVGTVSIFTLEDGRVYTGQLTLPLQAALLTPGAASAVEPSFGEASFE